LIAVLAAGAALSLAVSPALAGPDEGKKLFDSMCTACHTIGEGDKVGPDLKDVAGNRDAGWLAEFISNPQALFDAGDPDALALLEKFKNVPMPSLGLTETQVADVVAYLQQVAGTGDGAAPPTTTEPAPTEPVITPAPGKGDAAAGKSLFTGASRLGNGGPPCLSCHTIAGIGRLGGGTLGPDLTRSYTKYGGEAGIAGVLETLPFPTMTPLFAGKELTAEERTDLAAFLREAATAKRDSTAVWELLALGGAGVALLVALALLLWPRRALSVRKTLLRTRRGT
jgi:mono/diheme cytochrome c family protein